MEIILGFLGLLWLMNRPKMVLKKNKNGKYRTVYAQASLDTINRYRAFYGIEPIDD